MLYWKWWGLLWFDNQFKCGPHIFCIKISGLGLHVPCFKFLRNLLLTRKKLRSWGKQKAWNCFCWIKKILTVNAYIHGLWFLVLIHSSNGSKFLEVIYFWTFWSAMSPERLTETGLLWRVFFILQLALGEKPTTVDVICGY